MIYVWYHGNIILLFGGKVACAVMISMIGQHFMYNFVVVASGELLFVKEKHSHW